MTPARSVLTPVSSASVDQGQQGGVGREAGVRRQGTGGGGGTRVRSHLGADDEPEMALKSASGSSASLKPVGTF